MTNPLRGHLSLLLLLVLTACGGATSPAAKTHQLSAVGLSLGQMEHEAYLPLQEKWTGSSEAACNFFVETALCQYQDCKSEGHDVMAADYGNYLKSRGWHEVDLDTLEGLFNSDADFDVIIQSEGTSDNPHGHVLIPVSLSENHMLKVAQGELGGVPNEIVTENDQDLMSYDGGMHIWISQ